MHLCWKRKGAEVIPTLLCPLHKDLQGVVEEGQVEILQTCVLRLAEAKVGESVKESGEKSVCVCVCVCGYARVCVWREMAH